MTGLTLQRDILVQEHITRELKQHRELIKVKYIVTTQLGREAHGVYVIIQLAILLSMEVGVLGVLAV
jgi:hypothetical protein